MAMQVLTISDISVDSAAWADRDQGVGFEVNESGAVGNIIAFLSFAGTLEDWTLAKVNGDRSDVRRD